MLNIEKTKRCILADAISAGTQRRNYLRKAKAPDEYRGDTVDAREAKLKKLLQNEEFTLMLFSLAEPSAAQELLAANGVDMTDEEIDLAGKILSLYASKGRELSEDELGEVSGGSVYSIMVPYFVSKALPAGNKGQSLKW